MNPPALVTLLQVQKMADSLQIGQITSDTLTIVHTYLTQFYDHLAKHLSALTEAIGRRTITTDMLNLVVEAYALPLPTEETTEFYLDQAPLLAELKRSIFYYLGVNRRISKSAKELFHQVSEEVVKKLLSSSVINALSASDLFTMPTTIPHIQLLNTKNVTTNQLFNWWAVMSSHIKLYYPQVTNYQIIYGAFTLVTERPYHDQVMKRFYQLYDNKTTPQSSLITPFATLACVTPSNEASLLLQAFDQHTS